MQNRIFSLDNSKASKALAYGWLNAIHYMAPHTLGGVGNLCVDATEACKFLCLGEHSGRAGIVANDSDLNGVRKSRRAKAQRFMRDRQAYLRDMIRSIELVERKAIKEALRVCVRPNGSTDIPWESIKDESGQTIVQRFSRLQFLDYTKSFRRAMKHARGELPANYFLCFSRSESNDAQCIQVLEAGGTVAAVFACGFPDTWNGFPVIDGDRHDLRHLDPRGHVVALTPKGRKAKADRSGFVIRSLEPYGTCPAAAPVCRPIDLAFVGGAI